MQDLPPSSGSPRGLSSALLRTPNIYQAFHMSLESNSTFPSVPGTHCAVQPGSRHTPSIPELPVFYLPLSYSCFSLAYCRLQRKSRHDSLCAPAHTHCTHCLLPPSHQKSQGPKHTRLQCCFPACPSHCLVSPFSLTILSSYNSHAITFTFLRFTVQWLLVYSQSCATITTISFRTL